MFDPDRAVQAGFLDALAPTPELLDVARRKARELRRLDMRAHLATKKRARAELLGARSRAIEADHSKLTTRP